MTMISAIENGRCEALVEGLRAEFGAILADRILEAEAADYLWEARLKERYLGQHIDVGLCDDEDERELARVAILSFLGGRWHTASCLVDGEGMVVDLLWKRSFDSLEAAEAAFDRAA
jgi:hypothetical protein